MQLSDRQRRILAAVVREYRRSQRPVGSRTLVANGAVEGSASTIRNDLARLEELGMLEHPHTSAGRVPTDIGYRHYVDHLMDLDMESDAAERDTQAVDRRALRDSGQDVAVQLDDELERVTNALSEVTGFLALATSPSRGGVVRHVEVLDLGAGRICTVCITAEGDVTRHIEQFPSSVDPGLVQWAQEYLNERLTGVPVGRHLLSRCLSDAELGPAERVVLQAVLPAFAQVVDTPADLHYGGTRALLNALGDEVAQLIGLAAALDERRQLLEAMANVASFSVSPGQVSVRIGLENELPELHPLSVVGARYGAHGVPIGVVGVIGPRSMDYPRVVAAVASAADHLGRTAAER